MPEFDPDRTRYDLPRVDDDPERTVAFDQGLGFPQASATPASTGQEEPVPAPRKKRNKGLISGIVVGALILILGVVYLVDLLTSRDQIAQGSSVAGVDVGGMTQDEAVAAVEAAVGPGFAAPIVVTALGKEETVSPTEAGLSADITGTVASLGVRSADPIARIKSFSQDLPDVPVRVSVDEKKMTAWLTSLAGADDVAAVEGSVTIEGTEVVVVQPVVGEHLDVEASTAQLLAAWQTGDPQKMVGLVLPEADEPVRVSPEGVKKAADKAKKVLSGPLTVVAGDKKLTVPLETIAAATTIEPDAADGFDVSVDPAPIQKAFEAEAKKTDTEPSEASLAMAADGPQITESVDGRAVDIKATMAKLGRALTDSTDKLTVVYQKVPPKVSTADIKKLGIKEKISDFQTCCFAYDSGQNVKRTAEIVDGAIVMPGETFSLNNYTGPRGLEQGFVEAGIIQDGVASRAVGGGISQFATTIYNAAYFAGLQDVEHKAHSFYISRYPEGREATVFQNPDGSSVIDVAFKNTSDTAIWIQTVWTENDITVNMWGTKHVNVESVTGDRYNYTSPVTKTIPYGQPCSPSSGSSGFSVDNTRIITDLDGKEISRETQTTAYNGQQATICEPAPVTTPPAGSGEPQPSGAAEPPAG